MNYHVLDSITVKPKTTQSKNPQYRQCATFFVLAYVTKGTWGLLGNCTLIYNKQHVQNSVTVNPKTTKN